jgi:hypothetical protein
VIFFKLLWETGGSQTDVVNLHAEDVDWVTRRLHYARQKLPGLVIHMNLGSIVAWTELKLLREGLAHVFSPAEAGHVNHGFNRQICFAE